MTRVAIFWNSFPNYIIKCVETLSQHENTQVMVYSWTEGAFPNALDKLRRLPNINLLEKSNSHDVFSECIDFNPDVALFTLTRRALTHRRIFARVASEWRKSGTLCIGTCDHFWKGDWRDYANLLAAKLGWFSQYEAIMVPGALGKIYARKIGFPEHTIFDGMYTCDTEIFQHIGRDRHHEKGNPDWPRVFLFVGQFIRRKGLDVLLQAYQRYRQQASNPWELWLIGRGELENEVNRVQGVRNLGLKSSSQIADIMAQAGCFVIPSRVDHWPLVIHEASSAGLPILASSMCGSTVELVQSGFNGYVFPVNDEVALSRLLLFMDESGLAQEMGRNSLHLASRFSPEFWVKRILVDIPLLLKGQALSK